jgi:hypothetical protein
MTYAKVSGPVHFVRHTMITDTLASCLQFNPVADQEACSRSRSLARHRPRVGPMLPIGSPSWSEISA